MFKNKTQSVLLLFLAVNLFGFLAQKGFLATSLKINFILVVNAMLMLMYFVNAIRIKQVHKTNPNAMIRSVMMGTLLKMVVFVSVAMVYTTQVKVPVGIPTLMTSMGLYLFYTWLEIKGEVYKK
jgi:hypothetical protein